MARTTFRIWPSKTEGWTRFSITGSLPDEVPRFVLHQLLALLAYWGGPQVDFVFRVGDRPGWLEFWCDALAEAPGHHLYVHFLPEEERFSE